MSQNPIEDQEVDAIVQINMELKKLETPEQVQRVLHWAWDRYVSQGIREQKAEKRRFPFIPVQDSPPFPPDNNWDTHTHPSPPPDEDDLRF